MWKKGLVLIILIIAISSAAGMAASVDKVAAVVNGQNITVNEVDQFTHLNQKLLSISKVDTTLANMLVSSPDGQKLLNDYRRKELQNLIRQKLLLEEANNQKLRITDIEKENIFNQQINVLKQKNNWSDQNLLDALAKQGYKTLDDYKKSFFQNYSDFFLINKLKKTILGNKSFTVSDKEVKDYYDQHQDSYTVSGKLKALTDVKAEIKKKLLQQKGNDYWQQYINQLVSKANVNIKL